MSPQPPSPESRGLPPGLLPEWLDWIEQRNIEGIHVGVENRVRSLEACQRMISAGSLPRDGKAFLICFGAILCRSSESQGAYRVAVGDFLSQQSAGAIGSMPRRPGGSTSTAVPDVESRRPFPWAWLGLGILLAGLVWLLWPPTETRVGADHRPPIQPATNPVPIAGLTPNATFRYFTNVIVTTNTGPARPDPSPERNALVGSSRAVALACALGLLAWGWDRLRRRLYLRQGPSISEAAAGLVSSVDGSSGPLDRIAKDSAEGLRQRRSGQTEVFDLAATQRATLRAAGAFSPRFRRVATTPAYLFLIQREHPRDHFAEYQFEWIARLARAGVACDVFTFRTAPGHGCFRWDPSRPEADAGKPVALNALLEALPANRLVVMSDPEAGIDFLSGRPYRWILQLAERPEKAWMVPRPRPAWGRRESALRDAGFVVMPSSAEAFTDLATAFGEGQVPFETEAGGVRRYPGILQTDPIGLLARTHAPDPATLEKLVNDLRAYLGPLRFQWLCATCLFPAVSPGLTRFFGQFFARPGNDAAEMDQDRFALASLPFQRHAVIPLWLRRRLIRELGRTSAVELRGRLTAFLLGMQAGRGNGSIPVGASAPQPRVRHLWDWISSRTGLAGDSVLVEFLNPGHLAPLAQRLPEAVRQRLFPEGVAAYGLKPWVAIGLLCLGLVAWAAPRLLPQPGPVKRGTLTFTQTNFLTTPAFTNSLGMVFVPVTSAGVWFSAWETRVQDYTAYAAENPKVDGSWRDPVYQGVLLTPGPRHPVVNVSWFDATNFCHWLTLRERKTDRLPAGYRYRLPTDLEWSAAVGLNGKHGETPAERSMKLPGVYPWGRAWPPPSGSGNFADETAGRRFGRPWGIIAGFTDGYATTSPVGGFQGLPEGMYDLSGNVWEWCEDRPGKDGDTRVLRGGSWRNADPDRLLSSYRADGDPVTGNGSIGFRVVLGVDGSAR